MKKTIIALAALASCATAHADEIVIVPVPAATDEAVPVPIGDLQPGGVVATTLRADGSTNTWTAAELQAALGLMNRMYKREVETDAGRRRWHGERIGQYLLPTGETNALGRAVYVRVDLYQDGFTATNRMVKAHESIIADPEAAAKAAAEAKRRADEARAAWESANLPADLAALRALQRMAAKTNEVTVIVGP